MDLVFCWEMEAEVAFSYCLWEQDRILSVFFGANGRLYTLHTPHTLRGRSIPKVRSIRGDTPRLEIIPSLEYYTQRLLDPVQEHIKRAMSDAARIFVKKETCEARIEFDHNWYSSHPPCQHLSSTLLFETAMISPGEIGFGRAFGEKFFSIKPGYVHLNQGEPREAPSPFLPHSEE